MTLGRAVGRHPSVASPGIPDVNAPEQKTGNGRDEQISKRNSGSGDPEGNDGLRVPSGHGIGPCGKDAA